MCGGTGRHSRWCCTCRRYRAVGRSAGQRTGHSGRPAAVPYTSRKCPPALFAPLHRLLTLRPCTACSLCASAGFAPGSARLACHSVGPQAAGTRVPLGGVEAAAGICQQRLSNECCRCGPSRPGSAAGCRPAPAAHVWTQPKTCPSAPLRVAPPPPPPPAARPERRQLCPVLQPGPPGAVPHGLPLARLLWPGEQGARGQLSGILASPAPPPVLHCCCAMARPGAGRRWVEFQGGR